MFKLTLTDRNGTELNIGDVVKISNGREFQFYAEVKYLEDQRIITPFHTFSFHSFEKVDKLPDNAVKCDETRYGIWHIPNPESDISAADYDHYLTSWRECERLIEKNVYRINTY